MPWPPGWKSATGAKAFGVNVGANKDSTDRAADYVEAIERLAHLVDFATVNVSSPNTPGLRTLQGRDELERLLDRVLDARARLGVKTAIVLKIAPDLNEADLDDIAAVATDRRLDAMILGNTTISRAPTLKSKHKAETGVSPARRCSSSRPESWPACMRGSGTRYR